jgi:chromosome condensin MukBEF MukE localization factor
MAQSTRERRLRFIKSFGFNALEKAIMAAVHRHGAEHFLTDDQLEEITAKQVADWRSAERLNRENRNRRAAA